MTPGQRLTLSGVLVLVSFIAFDTIGVATAMPAIAVDLQAGGAYSLAFSVFLAGSLAGQSGAGVWVDLRGVTWPLLTGVALFAGGMIWCALAATLTELLAARTISGVGAGIIMVAIFVLVAGAFDDEHRPRVFGYISAAWVLPALIGPLIAGWFATEHSWRAVFWLGVPFALAATAALLPALRRLPPPEPQDSTGMAGRAGWGPVLAVAALAIPWATQSDGPLPARLAVGALGVALAAVSVPRLLPPGTLRGARGLPAVIATRGILAGAYFGAEAYIPLAVHTVRGLTLTEAGLALTASSIGWAFGSWLQGRDTREGASRAPLLRRGAVHVVLGIVALPLVMLQALSPWLVILIWALAAIGMGLAMATSNVVVMAMSPPELRGRNGAALNVAEGLGNVSLVALAGTVYAVGHGRVADPLVFSAAWLLLAALAAVGLLLSSRVRAAG